MKHSFKLTNLKTYVVLGLLGLVFMASCQKHDDYDFSGTVVANVQLVNTSPDAGPAKLYMNDVLRTETAVNNGSASGYAKTYVGQNSVNVQSASGAVLASTTSQLDAEGKYTYYLTGTSGNYALLSTTDNTDAPASGKANVRFVQTASNLSSANLLINGTSLFTAQSFKSVSTYNEVNAGAYIFKLTNGSAGEALATTQAVTLEAGKSYTLYVSGTTSLSLNVLNN